MSKKRKNFHYHYAEKFESRSERMAKKRDGRRFAVRPVALFLSLMMLVLFGFVSITFSSYVTSSSNDNPGGMLVAVRNKAIRSDTTSYGLAQTGAMKDLQSVGTNDPTGFGYRGAKNGWNYTAFTRYRDTQLGYYTSSGNGDFKITNGETWDNAKVYSQNNYTLGEGYANKGTLETGKNNITDNKTGTHYICFVNDNNSNKYTWYKTTEPTSDESTIYIRNTANASDIRLYIYEPQLYDWNNSPYILQSNVVQTGGSNGWTVTELEENGGTKVYKVEGVYNGKVIIRYGNSQSPDNVTVTDGASYDTVNNNGANKNTNYTPPVPETKYTVTVQSEDTSKGTVASASVEAGSTAVTLPTATPEYGWKFKNWTTSDSSIHITNADSASGATVSADAAGTVTANFEKNDSMNLYIAGRFHVYSNGTWVNSFDNGDWSNTGDDNIKFTWDSTANKYKVETHASMKELTSQISSLDPWFFVYDKGNTKYWYRTTANTYLTFTNRSTALTKYDSKDDSQNAKLRFNDQNEDKPVTLFFDPTTKELSYEVPPFYNVAIANNITHGTVTADTNRTEPGNTVALTVTPEQGYVIGSVTYNDGTTTHTITPNNGVYSFTMPSHDVTVSATFNGVPTITSFLINNNTSATLNVADTATLSAPTLHAGGNSVTYAVTGDANAISISGNTVTALRPGTATITASLQGATESKSVTVTVTDPTVSFSGSVEELRSGTISVSSSVPTPTSYSWAVKSGSGSLISLGTATNQSSVTVNSLKAKSEGASATVVLTAGYSTGYTKAFEYTVAITDSPISIHGDFLTSDWSDQKMLYDATSQKYKITMSLEGSTTFNFDIKDGNDYYKNNTKITAANQSSYAPNTSGLALSKSTSSGSDCQIETKAEGQYTFYYNPTGNKLYIDDYPGIEYHVLGLDGTWEKSNTTLMTETSAGSGIYTLTKAFTPGNPVVSGENTGFKVYCNDGNWYAHSNTTFSLNKKSETLVSGDGITNLGLTPWYSGDYTFTFNSNSKLLTITGPTRSITVNAKFNGTTTTLGTVNLSNPSNDFFTLTDNANDTFTVTAKAHSQYKFLKWGDNSTSNSYTITTTSSNTTVTLNSEWTYRAYKVNFYTNGGTLTSAGDLDSLTTKTANSWYEAEYTYDPNGTGLDLPVASEITHSVVSGYDFAGWYEQPDFSGSPVTEIDNTQTGTKTYYAKWTVDVQFKDNIDANLLHTINGVTVDSDISSSAPDANNWSTADTTLENKGYEFTGSFDNDLTNISGSNPYVVHALYIPKTYNFTITLTPNNKVYDKNGNAIAPNGTLLPDYADVGQSQANPYVVKFGAAIKAQAEFTVPATLSSDIEYEWYIKDGSTETLVPSTMTSDSTNTHYKYTNENITTMMTQPASGDTGQLFQLYVRAKSKDYSNSDIDSGELVTSYSIYYIVKSPMNTITAVPDQMIYSSAPDLKANLDVDSSITSGNRSSLTTDYRADLQLYSKSSGQYSDLLTDQLIATNAGEFYALFNAVGSGGYTVADQSTERGVNNFKAVLRRPQGTGFVEDSKTARKEIAVGTNDNMASRPLFVSNLSGTDLNNKRVTLFYVNSRNTLSYLTSTSFRYDTQTHTKVYRFDIPSNVTTVFVAAFNDSKEYNMPTFDGTTVTWPSNCDCYSAGVTISSSTQMIKITGISGTAITAAVDTF